MTEEQLKILLDQQAAQISGYISRQVDLKIDAVSDQLNRRIDGIYDRLDGIAGRLDNDSTEQALTNNRHEQWIKQIAQQTDVRLAHE